MEIDEKDGLVYLKTKSHNHLFMLDLDRWADGISFLAAAAVVSLFRHYSDIL